MSETFSTRLKDLRESARLSQNEIARILGLAVSTFSRLESGQMSNPTIDTVARISAFFGVTQEWLVTGRRPMFPNERPDQAWARYSEILAAKLGTEDEIEAREEKLLAELSARISQAPHCSDSEWDEYQLQIANLVSAHAEHCRQHRAELAQARLKIARAQVGKRSKN